MFLETNKKTAHLKSLSVTAIVLVLLLCSTNAMAQTIVKGFVRDAITKRPMPFVSIVFTNGKGGVSSNEDGSYSISTASTKLNSLTFSYAGYINQKIAITPGTTQNIDVMLELSSNMKEVVVKRGRGKYRNKNNPAVELIEKVIENKEKNQITAYDYVQYQQYEKLGLALANKPEKLVKNKLFKGFSFMMENIDTTLLQGRSVLPVYLEEKLSEKYLRKDPREDKTIMLAEKKVNYGDLFDNAGISSYLKNLYTDINIYDNNIPLLSTQFLSPIANMAPAFYRFYIRDTAEVDGIKLIRLNFTPKNPNDLLFRGVMYVTLDGNYGVQKIDLTVSKKANLNWTRELRISQDFERGFDGRYHLIKSDMITEFALVNNSSGGMIGERMVSYKNVILNVPAPESIYKGKDLVYAKGADNQPDSFWLQRRHQQLSKYEAKTYSNIDSLRNMKSFKTFTMVATALFSGYVVLNKYEIGNTNTFYSFNPVEGFRLRVGGRTTPKFSQRLYFENYLAYGFNDQRYKYMIGATYSFNNKSIYSFPLNYLRVSYQNDMRIPGQELQFVQEDNFLLSFKRGNNDRWLYTQVFRTQYVKEFGKNLAVTLELNRTKQTPAGVIVYEKNGPVQEIIPDITTTELSAELRWAPNEQFYQTKNFRIPIINKYPIFRLRYKKGIRGLLGGEYNYGNLNLTAEKRVYLSQLGFCDVYLEGGYIFGKVPFPLLNAHRANQTFGYQFYSYNLMNFLEFVSDKYAGATFDMHFNGFFLNKIPLLRKLKLREVASAKILYGSVRDENDPAKTQGQMKWLTDPETGDPITFSLKGTPYIEVSAGLANIFKVIRVDVVKRVTYLENPVVTPIGVRVKVRFEF